MKNPNPMVDPLWNAEGFKCYFRELKHVRHLKDSGFCLMCLAIVDIFRTRKYLFCRRKTIEKELAHLLSETGYPAHYPPCLLPETTSSAPLNPVWLPYSAIKDIWTRHHHFLDTDPEEKGTVNPNLKVSRIMITERFWSQLLQFTTVGDFMGIFSTMIETKHAEIDLAHHSFHRFQQTSMEKSAGMFNVSIPTKIPYINSSFLNCTRFYSVQPKDGTYLKLLREGEFSACLPLSLSYNSYSTEPLDDDEVHPILYCNFYNFVINKGDPFNMRQSDFYHYHLAPKSGDYYKIVEGLKDDHIVSKGMYRLGYNLKFCFQMVEKFNDCFTAENYVRKMLPPANIKGFINYFDGSKLVKILESIPNFVYSFSEQQRDLITTQHNSVVIGRSGTGKTTCAVMRMIGIQLMTIASRNLERGKKKITYSDLCEKTYLKMVFITASPILARNVKKLYHRVLNYLKMTLFQKEKEQKEQKAKEGNQNKESTMEEKNIPAPEVHPEDEFVIINEDPEEGQDKQDTEAISEEKINAVKEVMGDFDVGILKEDEMDIDELIGEIDLDSDKSEIPNSFSKVGFEDFPLFLTVRELLYLLDSLMPTTFFLRGVENMISQGVSKKKGKRGFFKYQENRAGNRLFDSFWEREDATGELLANKEDVSSDEDDVRISLPVEKPVEINEKQPQTAKAEEEYNPGLEEELLFTEVEWPDFRDNFFPQFLRSLKGKVQEYKNYSPTLAWTMIRNLDYRSLQLESKGYQIGKAYEAWKARTNNYDMNDLYQHLYKCWNIEYVASNLFDFLFLDEIQDIPVHILNFLRRFGSKYFYFSGDNAQNITKGVTLKFSTLVETYNSFNRSNLKTNLHCLTVNYRSHQKILDLGNNLIFHLRMFFPEQIEFLPPEESTTTGPKPMVLDLGMTAEDFTRFMVANMNAFEKDGVMNFKNSQVFITRDFEGKQQVLERYSRAICFTILEAKGMEFQDVILYNYFTDSKSHSPWFILRECLAVESKKVKGNKPPHFSGGMVEYRVKSGDLPDEYIEYRLSIDKTRFEQMCKNSKGSGIEDTADELKLLYVAVTRARQRLVFFDETQGVDPEKHRRSYFDGIWTELNLVNRSSDKKALSSLSNSDSFDKAKTSLKWIKEGVDYMQKGLYEYAEICFLSGDCSRGHVLASLCKQAISLKKQYYLLCAFDDGKEDQGEMEETTEGLVVMDVREEKAKLEDGLRKVALGFTDIGKLEQAAQCYSMIGDLEGCLEVYKLANMPERIAACLVQMKRFDEAKEYYRKSNDLYGLLSAIELSGNCEEALEMITSMSQQYGEKEKEKLNAIRMRYLKQAISQFDIGLEKVADEQPTGQAEDGMEYSPPNVETNPVKLPAEDDQPEPALSKHDSLSFERVKSNSEGSFQVIDAAEALSGNNSEFDFINSEIDDLERLSESFVEVKLEGSTIKTNKTSLFEGLCEEAKEYNISINQEQIIGKVMRYCNLHFDLISKIIPHKKPEEDEPIFECDLFEVSESKFNTIMNFLEYCNSTTLRLMIEKKLEVNIQSIDIILSSVFPVSQITYPSILLSEVKMKLNQTGWKQRRLCTMGFQNILSGFQKNLLMDNIYRNYESCLPAFNTMVLLGYFRQIIPLLKPQDRCKLLEAYGEIQTLMVIKCFKEENDLWDRDAFLNDMIMNIPLDKVCKIYLNFGQDEELLNCTLAYFCNFYMWDLKTFAVPEAKIEQFKEVNASLYRLFKLLYLLFAHKLVELDHFVQSIDRRSLEGNTVENGILNGVIYRISLAPADQLFGLTRQQMFESKGLKSLLSIILFLRIREDHLLRSDKNLFTRGLLMSFKAMNISADCMALRAFLPIGSIIHKTSPLLNEFDKSNSGCFIIDGGNEFLAIDTPLLFLALKSIREKYIKFSRVSRLPCHIITLFPKYFESLQAIENRKVSKIKNKAEMEDLLEDDDVSPHLIKMKKNNQVKAAASENAKPMANSEISQVEGLLKSMMNVDWTGKDVTVSRRSLQDYLVSLETKIASNYINPRFKYLFKYLFIGFNVCVSHGVLHVFRHLTTRISKRKPILIQGYSEMKDLLFDIMDSEYSLASGNTTEFIEGKIRLLEYIQDHPDAENGYLVKYLLEDIAFGLSVGKSREAYMIPKRIYHRRVELCELLASEVKPINDNQSALQRNPFNRISEDTEALARDALSLPAYRTHMKGLWEMIPNEDEGYEINDSNNYVELVCKEKGRNEEQLAEANLKQYYSLKHRDDIKFGLYKNLRYQIRRINKKSRPGHVKGLQKDMGWSMSAKTLLFKYLCKYGSDEEGQVRGQEYVQHLGKYSVLFQKLRVFQERVFTKLKAISSWQLAHQKKVMQYMDSIYWSVAIEERVLGDTFEQLASKLPTLSDDYYSDELTGLEKKNFEAEKYRDSKNSLGKKEALISEFDMVKKREEIKNKILARYRRTTAIKKRIIKLTQTIHQQAN
jgi:hypothetical protein